MKGHLPLSRHPRQPLRLRQSKSSTRPSSKNGTPGSIASRVPGNDAEGAGEGAPGEVQRLSVPVLPCDLLRLQRQHREVRKQYPSVFKFETRDYPLNPECGMGGVHPNACEAAAAVRLAREHGKGPELEAWLFEHQEEESRSTIKAALERIAGVKPEEYEAKYKSSPFPSCTKMHSLAATWVSPVRRRSS